MHYRVALFTPPYTTLTYCDPPWLSAESCPCWQVGIRVAVPLGNGAVRAGLILEAGSGEKELPEGVHIRPMLWPLDTSPLLSEEYLDLIRQLAARQSNTAGYILGAVLPQGLRLTSRIRVREFVESGKPVHHALRELAKLPEAEKIRLGRAFTQGKAEVLALKEDAAATELCELLVDPPWSIRPQAARQRQVLEYLWVRGAVSRRELHTALPGSSTVLNSLLKARLLHIRSMREDEEHEKNTEEMLLPPLEPPFELSLEQRATLAELTPRLASGTFSSHLLFGVTGSGKTAVYLELALACLSRGLSALLLAPEVALALKLHRDVSQRFPDVPVFLFHGYQDPPQRENLFRRLAARRSPCMVIGTRSALFLPLPPLGVIILDEEHDASFKQDEGFHYQAKEVAWHRAAQHKALLVLGSATPDIKTYHAALNGSIPLSRLNNRVGGGTLPSIELVNIRDHASSSLLAPASLTALKETVEKGEQAVVLLNRRGYAPLMYCLDCGKVARCPQCDIGLTYHKKREQLVCHYCGHTRPFPSPCAHCNGLHFHPMGEGTERLEERLAGEDLAQVLGGAGRVLRLDRDSARRPGRMEEILAAFARQEAQILVGTQMLSKGHHFPQVTLAVVADADLGLNLPDYRAAERSFQLLLQSAGRAGRGEKPGQVLIQTRDEAHYCWNFVKTGDYDGFYQQEIELRRKRHYPPFVKLALVRVSYPMDQKQGLPLLHEFATALRANGSRYGVFVLGPAPSPLARLQNRLRYQFLLKADEWQAIRTAYTQAGKQALPASLPKDWRLSLDLDPVNMM